MYVHGCSKVWVCNRSLAGIVGCLLFMLCVVRSGQSLIQRNPTERGVSECDHEASIMRRPLSTRGCCAMGGKKMYMAVAVTENFTIHMFYHTVQIKRNLYVM
jgi:hypothetical protein